MWFWLVKSIAGSIIGSATANWFKDTKAGVWFFNKVDSLYNWAAKRYNVKLLTDEEKRSEPKEAYIKLIGKYIIFSWLVFTR